MALDPEVLNHKVENPERISTGVYMSHNRNTAIVVKVDKARGAVHYLSYSTGTLRLLEAPMFAFARDFAIGLPNYPVRRAVRSYNQFAPCEDLAKKIIRSILGE